MYKCEKGYIQMSTSLFLYFFAEKLESIFLINSCAHFYYRKQAYKFQKSSINLP